MKNRNPIRNLLMTGIAAACFAVPALADSLILQPVHEGNVAYITGGIGADEQQALRDAAKDYNLEISSANPSGQYTAGADFQITGKGGHEMISVTGTGPLFYAKLPAGEYTVRAANGGQSAVRNVSISAHKTAHLHLIWKQD